jgi:hypothetical protein
MVAGCTKTIGTEVASAPRLGKTIELAQPGNAPTRHGRRCREARDNGSVLDHPGVPGETTGWMPLSENVDQCLFRQVHVLNMPNLPVTAAMLTIG